MRVLLLLLMVTIFHSMTMREAIAAWDDYDKAGTDLDGIAVLAKHDRFYLLVKVLRRTDALHPWIYARCREVEREPDDCLDLWARFHYKSTVITFAGAIQEILRDPEITIGIFSHTRPDATKFLRQIKLELESNAVLKAAYPDIFYQNPIREALRWSEEGITVKRKGNRREATVEAHGLVEGMPTGAHFQLRIYDDVVTDKAVTTPEQIQKATAAWELSDNLGMPGGRRWHIGTRYCTIGSMKILMSDWTHRPIEEVGVGDEVVGWELRDGKRWLRPAKVVNRGMHAEQGVSRYHFDNGRSVVCTPDHRWWRGPHGGGPEYAPLRLPEGKRLDRQPKGHKADGGLVHIRELLVPVEKDYGRDAGWLAGFFDGEGHISRNGVNQPSGQVNLTQTKGNGLIEEAEAVLERLGFGWTETWHSPSKVPASRPSDNQAEWKDRCVIHVTGGWRERYRFMAQVAPARNQKLAESLFAQLMTKPLKLTAIEPAGFEDVHWLETETGNYVVEGFCSSNSFADTYQSILERGILKARVYAATDDGTKTGRPVMMSAEEWADKLLTQSDAVLSCQMLQNPIAGLQAMFDVRWLQRYEIRPRTLMCYLLIDPARSQKKDSANTAMIVLGLDSAHNKFVLDGYNHKMALSERWDRMKMLRHKWLNQRGVQAVTVGYEHFGADADFDYFEERMTIEGRRFDIVPLEWPREGPGSKVDRVQRLQPDMKQGRIYLPYVGQVTALQQKTIDAGEPYRVSQAIRQKDNEGNLYDVIDQLKVQIGFFPFGGLVDLVDALSRIYDMDFVAPAVYGPQQLEPEAFVDS